MSGTLGPDGLKNGCVGEILKLLAETCAAISRRATCVPICGDGKYAENEYTKEMSSGAAPRHAPRRWNR